MTETALLPVEMEEAKWELKTLTPRHKQIASLLAQGHSRGLIAQACDIAPEYVSVLARQPIFQEYIKEMSKYVNIRMEALFEKSVDTIAEAMDQGNYDEKIKAAKLQLEATGRVGRYQGEPPTAGQDNRLEVLAERLVSLLQNQRKRVYDQVEDATIVSP